MSVSRLITLSVAITALATLSACSNAREALIPGKSAPDEFAVYTRAPLSLPPEYNLRVPEPGTERTEGATPTDTAMQAVLGTTTRTQTHDIAATPGIDALLRNTGAYDTDPSIRQVINQETSILAEEDKTITDAIMFWDVATEYGSSVNPDEELKRLQENQALGQPLNAGDVPTIEKKRKGLLEGVFD